MEELLSRIEALEDAVSNLRSSFAEVKNEKGIAGPRGPAGDYIAASNHATAAAFKALADAEARLKKVVGDVKAQHVAFEKQINDSIKNTVDSHTIQVLEDYGGVSSRDNKPIKAS